MKLALWANEPNTLHAEVRDMLFVMGKAGLFPNINVLVICV